MNANTNYHSESSYWRWLQTTTPLNNGLRWCHRTDAFALRDIIKDGFIAPRLCNIFNEPLIYLFYGRPAYRSQELQQLRISARAPVIIIFNNLIENDGVRLFPFDSGAFKSMYEPWRHEDMQLSAFHMPCGQHAAERHVSEFFRSCPKYLAMEPSRPRRSYAGEFEVEVITELVNDRSSKPADDRRLAIELQVNRNIFITNVYVTALIIPESISEATWLNEWRLGLGAGIKIETYQQRPLHTASHYQAKLEEICAELV